MMWLTFLVTGIIVLSMLVLGIKWKRLKLFFHDENYAYFDVCFVIIYFLEQAVFIVLSYFYPPYNVFLTGFFALIVISTVAMQKVMMESKNNRLAKLSNQYLGEFKRTRLEYDKNIEYMRDYIEILEEENDILKKNKK